MTVATYPYRCAVCGPFEVRRPIGEAAVTEECVGCGEPAVRVYTPPMLARTAPALVRALDAERASAHEPQVTQRVPARPKRPAPPPDPRWAKLPRP
ncbi:zinc ribbon domain-containing protein [Spongiactinospora rosea]|uniref:Zinc ribbon domain-containing protein n=1 Tax=Spongiactinospora rosea TaxID=2248750 RepID=A0A366LSW4_9ACTN|nr:FmdB family zinc ribbon protein [Spongiactinospora rosea]RBQ17008.1 zinc ribbon domain-containing protein [Spongiactinospora rosea]